MKKYFLISALFIAFVSCKNSDKSAVDKPQPLYDTIPKYDKATGKVIGDTIVSVASEKNMTFGNDDTIPVYRDGKLLGDSVRSSHTFIPAK